MKNVSLSVPDYQKDYECFQLLNRIPNLQVLTINAPDQYNRILNIIDDLNELIELCLDFTCDCDNFEITCCCNYLGRLTWNELVDFVKRLPKLQKLQLKCFQECHILNLIIYREFVDLYRPREAKLFINFIGYENEDEYLRIPADILEVYEDLCRFVEILN